MKSVRWVTASVLLQLALMGCTTVGTGAGQLIAAGAPEQPVAFSWTSTDGGMSGDMSGGGEGEYQLTGTRTVRTVFTSK